ARWRAEAEYAAGQLGVAALGYAPRTGRQPARRRIAERLPRVVEGFGVHLLVARRQANEIRVGPVYTVDDAIEHRLAIRNRVLERGQRQSPALVVRHGRRVVERVGVGQNRARLGLTPEAPIFLEPTDMAHFPARRIDDRKLRPELALARKVVDD